MNTRQFLLTLLVAGGVGFILNLSSAWALREPENSPQPVLIQNFLTSPSVSSVVQSVSQEKVTQQLTAKNEALLGSRYGAGNVEMNPTTGVARRLRGIPVAKGLKSTATLKDKDSVLRQFVDENPDLLGVKSPRLSLLSQTEKVGRSYFAYQQKVDGFPLFGAYLKAALDSQGNLSVLTSSCWPEVEYSATTSLTEAETAALSAQRITHQKEAGPSPVFQLKSSEKVLYPLSSPQGTLFQIAYLQVIHLEEPLGDWVTVVDANSGQEYVRYNNYRFATLTGTVQGEILPLYGKDTPQVVSFKDEYVDTFAQTPAYSWDLSTDPGWTREGLWAFGTPSGKGGSIGDESPTSGHTGTTVLGYNLSGGYINNITSAQYLTTPAIDCSALSGTHLSFWRWLGIDIGDYLDDFGNPVSMDNARVEVSNNGTDWVRVWSSYAARMGQQWEYCIYDISATADATSTVYVRWAMGPTNSSITYAGLYIDDINILAGGGAALTSASGEFSLPAPISGTPVLFSELKGPYADVINEDGPRLQYHRASSPEPADLEWDIPNLSVAQSWDLSSDPGWSTTGEWAWGTPSGSGGDPSQGHTGQYVYGYNLSGAYVNHLTSTYYLTTSALDCSGYTGTHLRFWRWLGIELDGKDSVSIQVSTDQSSWHTVYQNPSNSLQHKAWQQVIYDISFVADGQSTVYIRWSLGPTNSSVVYSGWNIDDIELLTAAADSDYTLSLYDRDELNLFYHMGAARKSIKAIDPSYTALDLQMPGVVRLGTDYNNAYYDFRGLCFGEGDGSRCGNFAHFADVIYHEYGHAVTHGIYPLGMLLYTGESGAMDESWSDYFACTTTNDSMIGEGGLILNADYMRNLDNDLSKPEDMEYEVHSDGRIIGAGLWNLRVLLGKDPTDHLWHYARYNLAETFEDYYEDLLITDDTDANLSNGTPHMLEIAKAFGPHGIGGLQVEAVSQEVASEIYVNGKLDAGETGLLLPGVTAHFVAGDVCLAAQSGSPYLSISDGNMAYGTMAYGSTVTKADDTVEVSISSSCPEDEILPVTFTLTATGGYSSTGIYRFINAPGQILYDEGIPESSIAGGVDGTCYAVRFTPPNYPVTLTTLRLWPGIVSSIPVPIVVKAWDDDGVSGSPGTELISGMTVEVTGTGEWVEIPLIQGQNKGITVYEGDVYVGWRQTATPYINGYSRINPDGRSWIFSPMQNQWMNLASMGYSYDLMTRVRYETPTEIPAWSGY